MRQELERLATASAGLDPTAAQRATWVEAVTAHAETWVRGLSGLPTLIDDDERAVKALADHTIDAGPTDIDELLAVLTEAVERPGATVPSPNFFGFIPSAGIFPAALGDYLAAVVNKYSGKAYGAPGAARLDRQLVEWLAEAVGYPTDCGGDLTSGASLATLSAIVSARQAGGFRAVENERQVVYLTDRTHAAVGKALHIAGLGECIVSIVPVDDRYRMRPDALEASIRRHIESGLHPWLVVATAGTTDTGSVDPLDAIADLAEAHELWMHVDAAYGGVFALTQAGAERLRGIERSDSLVLDPHKGLFLPLGSGAVLVKDARTMEASFSTTGACLRDTELLADVSASDVSGELSRPFRGLRLWLPLKLIGVDAFRAALDAQLLLARHVHAEISSMDGIEAGPEPDLSIVTFRVIPDGASDAEADAATQRVVDAILADAWIFLSSTEIADRVVIRMAILNPRTHLEHVDRALDVIRELVERELAA